MYPFNKIIASTEKKSPWTNRCKWIVIHHTAAWTFASNMKFLSTWAAKSSCHFVIWEFEERGKIWEPTDILRHAWNGSWKWIDNVNNAFMWIEVVWKWERNIKQLIALTDLVEYLMYWYNIENDMIIRHSDCTQRREITRQWFMRDWERYSIKKDIWLDFFWGTTDDFLKWRSQLTKREKSRYGLYK